MGYNFRNESPCYSNQLKKLLKTYPKSEAEIKKEVDSVKEDPMQGLPYQGMSVSGLRKKRIALKKYKVGKSGGLRFIFLVSKKRMDITRIAIYQEKDYGSEGAIKRMIRENIKAILREIDNQ